MVGREKGNLITRSIYRPVTGLLLQDCYKVQWILNISKKSPGPVFLMIWVVKNLDGDGLRTVINKNQYVVEISKSWEGTSNAIAVAIGLFNYKTYNNQRSYKIMQNEDKLCFISYKGDIALKPKNQKSPPAG